MGASNKLKTILSNARIKKVTPVQIPKDSPVTSTQDTTQMNASDHNKELIEKDQVDICKEHAPTHQDEEQPLSPTPSVLDLINHVIDDQTAVHNLSENELYSEVLEIENNSSNTDGNYSACEDTHPSTINLDMINDLMTFRDPQIHSRLKKQKRRSPAKIRPISERTKQLLIEKSTKALAAKEAPINTLPNTTVPSQIEPKLINPVVKRGRPRKPDSELKQPRRKPAARKEKKVLKLNMSSDQ